MSDAVKSIVARTHAALQDAATPIVGTGFLVAPDRLLTCAHCVGSGPDAAEGVEVWLDNAGASSGKRSAKVIAWHGDLDVALLELSSRTTVSLLQPGPLPVRGAPWRAFGYPTAAGTDGLMLDGEVTDPSARAYGKSALQLHCSQAADSVRGASGAPVMVADHVVGILNLQLLVYDGAGLKPAHSALYAVGLDAIGSLGGEFAAALEAMRVSKPAIPGPGPRKVDATVLRKAMTGAFDKADLEVLLADVESRVRGRNPQFRMSIEDVGGDAKKEKVILDVIRYAEQRNCLADLVAVVVDHRREIESILFPPDRSESNG